MTLTCVKCGRPIDAANINIGRDVAFCAACGEMHKVSVLMAPQAAPAQPAPQPYQAAPQPQYQQPEAPAQPLPYQQPAVFPAAAVPPNTYAPAGRPIGADEKYCFSCGSPFKRALDICPTCGMNQGARSSTTAIDVHCTSCGRIIKREAAVCPFCGANPHYPPGYAPKSKTAALLLSIFLGGFGAHRFYVGKGGTGMVILLLMGLIFFTSYQGAMRGDDGTILASVCASLTVSIWVFIDFIRICINKFKDGEGYPLKKG